MGRLKRERETGEREKGERERDGRKRDGERESERETGERRKREVRWRTAIQGQKEPKRGGRENRNSNQAKSSLMVSR